MPILQQHYPTKFSYNTKYPINLHIRPIYYKDQKLKISLLFHYYTHPNVQYGILESVQISQILQNRSFLWSLQKFLNIFLIIITIFANKILHYPNNSHALFIIIQTRYNLKLLWNSKPSSVEMDP